MAKRKDTPPSHRPRIAVVWVCVMALFAAAGARSVLLQVVRAEELKERGARQRIRSIKIQAARGDILDRNMTQLAASIRGESVGIIPSKLENGRQDLKRIAKALSVDPKRLYRLADKRPKRFSWVKRGASPDETGRLKELRLKGVQIVEEPRRFYPNKSLAGQVVGFVGIDGDGLGGIEYKFNSLLEGREIPVVTERDNRNTMVLSEAPELAEAKGKSLVLTIEETIQHIAEEELAKAVAKSAAKGGTAVVMDPSTGEILAMAQNPPLDPNAPGDTAQRHRKPQTVTDVYEPGSTFKALLMGILFERGLVSPLDKVFCENGKWTVHGRTIHDHEPMGLATVEEVLVQSSNIGSAKLSQLIEPDDFYEGLRKFGIGVSTEIGLPGESRGILPEVDDWSKMTPRTLAYGHGVSSTTLQVASAVSAIANGGTRMKPRLVKGVIDNEGELTETRPAETAGTPLSPSTAATLTRLMEQVVYDEGGTGAEAAIPGYRVAGKTGTSWQTDPKTGKYDRSKIVASFMGFVPSDDPKLAIVVAVNEPQKGLRYGGTIAAPAFREMGKRILRAMKVQPTEENVLIAASPGKQWVEPKKKSGEKTQVGKMPDLDGATMRQALKRIEEMGVRVSLTLEGSGMAMKQEPLPGTPMKDGDLCRVVFKPHI